MTREKKIEELQRHRQEFAHDHGWSGSVLDALDAAIEALKAEECACCNYRIGDECVYGEVKDDGLMQEPSVQSEQKEITMEDVEAYCKPRNLVVLTKELFDKMNNTADEIYLYLKDKERR